MGLPTTNNVTNNVQGTQLSSFYSDRGTANIYELARFFIENGNTKSAEQILRGLTAAAPNYGPAWLALSYVNIMEGNIEQALLCAESCYKKSPHLKQAMLFQVSCHLTLRDLSAAGTILGEYGELIDNGQIPDPNHIRFYKTQIARFQALR